MCYHGGWYQHGVLYHQNVCSIIRAIRASGGYDVLPALDELDEERDRALTRPGLAVPPFCPGDRGPGIGLAVPSFCTGLVL